MGTREILATDEDFRIAFNALLGQAKYHGIAVDTVAMGTFIETVAEQIAEKDAKIRQLYNIEHTATL